MRGALIFQEASASADRVFTGEPGFTDIAAIALNQRIKATNGDSFTRGT
jgi:hypothetical protein